MVLRGDQQVRTIPLVFLTLFILFGGMLLFFKHDRVKSILGIPLLLPDRTTTLKTPRVADLLVLPEICLAV